MSPSTLLRAFASWLALGALAWSASALAGGALRGLSLTEALLALRERGLKIAFTSEVVRPEMRVDAEPTAATPTAILDEILRPHGLMAEAGPGGLFVVVPRPPADLGSGLRGAVRDRRTSAPLAGVRVLVLGARWESVSGDDGAFTMPDVAPGTYDVEARRPGHVVERLNDVEVAGGAATDVAFALEPAPIALDEIVVTPSMVTLLRTDPVAAMAFDRDEILALPHLGGDLFRALSLVPGISGNELSAEFHVRGGRTDEVLVMLDNVELFEPFHLRDFNDALSLVPPQAIAGVDLMLGGFPAQYGDRMGGVLAMNTVRPEADVRTRLGLSVLAAQAGNSGGFAEGRGRWLAVARRGSLELASDYLADEEQPRFWDAFAKVERQLASRHTLGARVLHADDRLDFNVAERDGESENVATDYGNSYVWLTHQALLGSRLLADAAVSFGRVDRDRRSMESEDEDQGFLVDDERVLEVAGVKQDWLYQAHGRHYLKWGVEARRLAAEYDYLSVRMLEDPLDDIRTDPREGTTVFRERLSSDQYAVYLADRVRLLEPLTVELGLRYDEQTLTRDRNLGPRINLVYAAGERSTLRAAWGHYYQSQRLYELEVADGRSVLSRAELTEDYVLGYEHLFRHGGTLRVNLYRRDVVRPRARYENVLEPVSPFPEVEPDRVRIDPQRSLATGVEVFLRGRGGPQLDWWASYVWSRTEDEIDGRDVPRLFDQPHAANVNLHWRVSPRWTIDLAWRYHTGWPTTAFAGALEENDEGELEPVVVFGPLNGERLPDYHRLDLRASRRWQLRRGVVTFYVELQNLYDRENASGFDADVDLEVAGGGEVTAVSPRETWGGILPSFGIDWEF